MKGRLEDRLRIYEEIADKNLTDMWHLEAIVGYNYLNDTQKAFGAVLRMAKARFWFAAAATQVRPMEFFTHPAIFPYLFVKDKLREIVAAFQN